MMCSGEGVFYFYWQRWKSFRFLTLHLKIQLQKNTLAMIAAPIIDRVREFYSRYMKRAK